MCRDVYIIFVYVCVCVCVCVCVFQILYGNSQSVELDGRLNKKLISNLRPETQYSFLLTSRGPSAGGLQHRVSAVTAPDLLRTKPILVSRTDTQGTVTVKPFPPCCPSPAPPTPVLHK